MFFFCEKVAILINLPVWYIELQGVSTYLQASTILASGYVYDSYKIQFISVISHEKNFDWSVTKITLWAGVPCNFHVLLLYSIYYTNSKLLFTTITHVGILNCTLGRWVGQRIFMGRGTSLPPIMDEAAVALKDEKWNSYCNCPNNF